jgi:hypothetical protein
MFEWLKKGKKPPPSGPDFSHVDTRAKAEALCQRGELHKLLLMPLEFGGQDVPPNAVFVPAFVLELKKNVDMNVVLPLIQQQKVRHYAAEPQYEGNSFVPSAIKIVASDPADFTTVLRIWGKTLEQA